MILIKVLEVLRLPQGECIKRKMDPEIRTQATLKLGKRRTVEETERIPQR